jgi:RND family efflux transporter MFP subunit
VAAVLALCGCRDAPTTAATPVEVHRQVQPRVVRTVPATEQLTDRRVTATGTLAADEHVVLGTKVAGRVAVLPVDLGSRVRRGDVVARLDPTDAQLGVDQAVAALKQARARLGLMPEGTDDRVDIGETALVKQAQAVLEEARLTRDRMVRLQQQGLIAQAQLDAAISSLGVAEGRYQEALEETRNRQAVLLQRRSELELARQRLADTVIASPIDGAVSERRASVGEYLAAGAPVATVVKMHPLRLKLAIPERDAEGVRIGQPVVAVVEGVPGEHAGRIARMSPAIDEQTRTLLVEAEVPNEASALRPGAFAKADIVVATDVPAVTVPATAVVTFAGVEKVLTVDGPRAAELRVQTGRRLGDRVEIVAGLRAGTPVVAQPGNLTAGQPVVAEP